MINNKRLTFFSFIKKSTLQKADQIKILSSFQLKIVYNLILTSSIG
jgi:hypothetical protein